MIIGDKMKGAILEKGEQGYTYLRKIFKAMNNFQKNYNWLISDCEACPRTLGHSMRIAQSSKSDGKFAWISGEELTGIVRKDDFMWIWAVLSGFDKSYTLDEVKKYPLPYADGYKGFWKKELSIQHPLASVELVAWDSSLTLFIGREDSLVDNFMAAFPLSEDLGKRNLDYYNTHREEYENWLKR